MNAAHLHLLVNHLPIIGAMLALPLLALALLSKADRGALRAAVVVLALSGAGAVAALQTGEPAEEVVEDLPGVDERAIHEHEERGEAATILSVLAAAAGIATLVLAERRGQAPQAAMIGVLGLSLLSAGAMAWTGAAGGPIRHSELRDGPATGGQASDGFIVGEAEGDED